MGANCQELGRGGVKGKEPAVPMNLTFCKEVKAAELPTQGYSKSPWPSVVSTSQPHLHLAVERDRHYLRGTQLNLARNWLLDSLGRECAIRTGRWRERLEVQHGLDAAGRAYLSRPFG
ncbi:hypothetical protein M758_10G136700 [Ceratodon purpureus]|nr:hypothetical protein M758_10G136700 [Ceratodon purpureus]